MHIRKQNRHPESTSCNIQSILAEATHEARGNAKDSGHHEDFEFSMVMDEDDADWGLQKVTRGRSCPRQLESELPSEFGLGIEQPGVFVVNNL